MIRTATIDCLAIRDWDTFHDEFARALGFPGWYGRNRDAWIDMMSSLDEDCADFKTLPGEIVVLDLSHAGELKRTAPGILSEILEMSAFSNWRRIESGSAPLLLVSCSA